MVESYIKNSLRKKEILLMTHIVLGYPTFEDSFNIIESMVTAGVDLMELQIPFSEPIADGPVILHANQKSLSRKTTVQKCMDFAQKVTGAFDIPFLFMSYYNILFKYGVNRFTEAMDQTGIKGAIVPDLPPEEGKDYLDAMEEHNLVPIFIFSPTTPDERMKYLALLWKGLYLLRGQKRGDGCGYGFFRTDENISCSMPESHRSSSGFGFWCEREKRCGFSKGKSRYRRGGITNHPAG